MPAELQGTAPRSRLQRGLRLGPRGLGVLSVLITGAILGGCAGPAGRSPVPTGSPPAGPPAATAAPESTPEPALAPGSTPITEIPTVSVTGVTDLVTGLDTPWGLAFLPDGRALVTLRDEARVVLVEPDGAATDVVGPGAEDLATRTTPGGEAGLLGVAVAPAGGPHAGEIYLYRTVKSGNEVVRAALDGANLGELEIVFDGIPKAANHDGGRIAFGPDGFLYVATGDAGNPPNAQAPDSTGGKILRLAPDGDAAPGNPTPGSPVWTSGHRNVQGLDWAPDGRMFASEFGQNTFDELNEITPGANYGWPDVEGTGGSTAGFTDPLATWPTSDASPSGLAVTAEGVYLAGLRGQRLWRVPLTADGVGRPQALLEGELGRLRAVVRAPDGSLWILTNNTDGRGDPRPGDDRLVRITVG